MDWVKIGSAGPGNMALREMMRQHLEECHGGFIVRMEVPYRCPTDDSEPQTRLSGTMEPEQLKMGCPMCTKSPLTWSVQCDCGSPKLKFCPWCGFPLAWKEE